VVNFQYFWGLTSGRKLFVMQLLDAVLLLFSVWFSFSLRLGEWYIPASPEVAGLMVFTPLVAIPIFYYFGLYRAVVRYFGMPAAWSMMQAVALYAVVWGVLVFLSGVSGVPRSVVLINAMVTLLCIGGSRALMRWIFSQMEEKSNLQRVLGQRGVVIFGAGAAGRQLATGVSHSPDYRFCGFVDEAEGLQGRELMGVPVLALDQLQGFTEKHGVRDLFLAVPSISREERNRIIEQLRGLPLRIRTVPSLEELTQGEVRLSGVHDLDVEDLLAREPAKPDEALLLQQVKGKTLLITGAGGSIGSEICRQVLRRKPKTLLLFDLSEFALYTIHNELMGQLQTIASEDKGASLVPRIVPLLGAVQDEGRMTELLQTWKVDTIYHAAASKHVPMTESNMAQSIKNNVLGTLTVAKMAIVHQVPNMVLISTDKAVRPTNLMGATKRTAELTLQALMVEKTPVFEVVNEPPLQVIRNTHLSMVRFGNVLGSSGSVVPLFRKQIENGGPITLTHQDITRYFMTIPEAAQLVMQAGAMSGKNSYLPSVREEKSLMDTAEVFVLDMGESVKIADLAKRMVELSGLRLRDDVSPEGDIEIKVTGLRPGEKLYEELLIGDNSMSTQHPRIMMAHEELIPWEELQPQLAALRIAAQAGDVEMIRELMRKLVKGYQPDEKISDVVYCEQMAAG